MSQKGTQLRAQENRSAWSVGRIQDAVRQKWQQIRQKVEALVREGLDALLFTFDRGADPEAPYEETLRQQVCAALRAQFGDSPAQLLMQTPPEKREQLAAQIHAVVAQALGMEASIVGAVPMGGKSGCYAWGMDALLMNAGDLEKQPVTLTEAKALLDTILHETFHALQRRAIVRPSRYGIPKAEAQIWRINFHNYIQPEQNPERYWLQPVEVTARVFAAQILNHFYD